jgi:hypothetical protein
VLYGYKDLAEPKVLYLRVFVNMENRERRNRYDLPSIAADSSNHDMRLV